MINDALKRHFRLKELVPIPIYTTYEQEVRTALYRVLYNLGGTELFIHGIPNFMFIGHYTISNYPPASESVLLFTCDYNGNKPLQDLITRIFNYLYKTSGNLRYICSPYVGKPGYPSYALYDSIFEKLIELSEIEDKDALDLLLRLN